MSQYKNEPEYDQRTIAAEFIQLEEEINRTIVGKIEESKIIIRNVGAELKAVRSRITSVPRQIDFSDAIQVDKLCASLNRALDDLLRITPFAFKFFLMPLDGECFTAVKAAWSAVRRELQDLPQGSADNFVDSSDTNDVVSAVHRFGVVESKRKSVEEKFACLLQGFSSISHPSSTIEADSKPKFVLPYHLLVSDNNYWLKSSQNIASSVSGNGKESSRTWLRERSPDGETNSYTSESIEMISHRSVDSECDGFTCLSTPDPSACRGMNEDNCKALMDIENLGGKSAWLLSSRRMDLRIGDVCCANEVCQEFSDCVCDVSCDERARKWLGSIEVGKSNLSNSQSSYGAVEWLKSKTVEANDNRLSSNGWLKRAENEKMDLSEKQVLDFVGEYDKRKWVKWNDSSLVDNDSTYKWLKPCFVRETKCQKRDDLKSYHRNIDNQKWLAS